MLGQQLFAEGVQGGVGCGYLGQNIRAVRAFFQPAPNDPNLSLHPVQPVDQAFIFILGAFFRLVAAGFLEFHDRLLSKVEIPTGGILNIYPLWVFVNIRMSIVFRDEHVFSVFAANTKIPICIILK